MEYVKLFDFRIYNDNPFAEESDDEHYKGDDKETIIQMFGMNEAGDTYSLYVTDFQPFFYVKVPDSWDKRNVSQFMKTLKKGVGNYYKDSIVKGKLVNKKTLYGFDNNKNYQFIMLVFKNTSVFNKARGLWYTKEKDFRKRTLRCGGWERTELYEAKLPPLLRLFHIKNISPSGWISYDKKDIIESEVDAETCCDHEVWIDYNDINPERLKEDSIPLKICSFDIEASSSHGDFPLSKKTYLKVCREIVTYWRKNKIREKNMEFKQSLFKELVNTAFGYETNEDMSKLFIKKSTRISKAILEIKLDDTFSKNLWFYFKKPKVERVLDEKKATMKTIEEEERALLDAEEEEFTRKKKKRIYFKNKSFYSNNIIYLLDSKEDVSLVADMMELIFEKDNYPQVEGDKVTFIGSTFMRMGEDDQYLNHMIVLNTCSKCPDVHPVPEIESYETEREVLLAWTEMIQREDPDVIIGYNIFGFDYKFMIERSEELLCKDKFLKLSRNVSEKSRIINSSIKIASGTHDLKYIEMIGRLQLDLYNYFRREVNLPSYKLDNVASHFIGDIVSNVEYDGEKSLLQSKNLMGLKNGHYICFEIMGHSNDMYRHGKKFIVEEMTGNNFKVSIDISELKGKKFRWCLTKDDVTPQDIFRLTNEGPDERAIIAKYCFQDCNLVHNLMKKNDILTGMSEIANICYVPISFIIMRGQGIKLLSFIAKKCSEKNTLMPVLDMDRGDSSYEGAICLKPKCGLYIDNPVAVVDYASLYPSSMISENISHDSKVWSKEYDLKGDIVIDLSGNKAIYGKQDRDGKFIYDNLPEYEYVDITYDRYIWRRKGTGKAQEKVKVGTKTCRFAQFPDGKKAIMPSVLHELLAGRKATRKFIKYKTITTKTGEQFSGLLKKTDTKYIMTGEKENKEYLLDEVETVEDTYNDFMKNVFDKRQQGLKVTANSLYGQCGARTSSFYEIDIAASTTATGRKLLIYGKKIIEGIYGDKICDTKYGKIHCKADVVYGDSVPGNEPLILRDENGLVTIKTIESLSSDWEKYENFKPFDTVVSNRREKQKAFVKYEVWAKDKWNPIKKVIRHKTNKKIYRVNTHTGVVDVTEDHSLINDKFEKIKPDECIVGETKLAHTFPHEFIEHDCKIMNDEATIWGVFMKDGICENNWSIDSANHDTLEEYKYILENIEPIKFKILDTLESSGVYKLVPTVNMVYMVNKYRSLFYDENNAKLVPNCILNASLKIRKEFFKGYNNTSKIPHSGFDNGICFLVKNKITAQCLYYLATSIGYDKLHINFAPNNYYTIISCKKWNKNPEILKKKTYLRNSKEEYVYDLETEHGVFACGVGKLQIFNTDSAFMTFSPHKLDGTKIVGKEALDITIQLAIECGELASKFLKPPHDLEYEKTFDPFLLLSKKRYVGMLYETDINKCKRKSMGIVLKRRDNAPVVKDIYGGIIDIIMKEQDIEKAVLFTKQFLRDIIGEKIGMEKLIITKSLRGFYKCPESIAHKVLADRMGKRDSGNKPSNGSRIPYIFIQTKGNVKLQGNRIENPDYIKKHKLKPDYKIYITNQIMKPVTQIFSLVLEQMSAFKKKRKPFERKVRSLQRKWKDNEKKCDDYIMKERDAHVKKLIFDDVLRIYDNNKNGQPTIQSMFGI